MNIPSRRGHKSNPSNFATAMAIGVAVNIDRDSFKSG
jgi:hypothetical protein